MDARIRFPLLRFPLRVLLPGLAASLAAAVVILVGVAGLSQVHRYLIRQTDNELLSCAGSMLNRGFVAPPDSAPAPGHVPGACDVQLLSASAEPLTPSPTGTGAAPAIRAGGSWLVAHLARPVTVPDASTGGRWRMVIEAVHYQPQRILYVYGRDDMRYLISGPAGRGRSGILVVMAAVTGVSGAADRVAEGYAAAAGLVLVVLVGAALAATRAIMRAGGERSRRRYDVALVKISERMRASRAAEAAARRSASGMSDHLSEAILELRTSVNVIRGFGEYWGQRDKPLPADVDRMMRRATGEVARMDTLLAEFDAPPRPKLRLVGWLILLPSCRDWFLPGRVCRH